jgi:hypothetical protein
MAAQHDLLAPRPGPAGGTTGHLARCGLTLRISLL